jgi:hypothetical protein
MPLYGLLKDGSFDPDDIDRMVAAYEAALARLQLKDRADPVCELVAKKIIDLARSGDHDVQQMCDRAIAELGIPVRP